MSVYREFTPHPNQASRAPELVADRRLSRWNPACENDQQGQRKPMQLDVGDLTFSCTYLGAQGDTQAGRAMGAFAKHGCI